MWDTNWFLHPERLTKQEEQAIQRAMADEDDTQHDTPVQNEPGTKYITIHHQIMKSL